MVISLFLSTFATANKKYAKMEKLKEKTSLDDIISKDAQTLYHPSYEVAKLTKMIESALNIAKRGSLILPYGFKLDGNMVRHIELDDFSVVLVHWEPNFSISRQKDPFCSALILNEKSLNKLYREVVRLLCEE